MERLDLDGIDWTLRLPETTVSSLVERSADLADARPFEEMDRDGDDVLDRAAEAGGFGPIASAYFGRPAHYAGSRVWWLCSERQDPLATGSLFHYDLYDFSAVVFLCYLTDVDAEGGPHVCIRSSHRVRRLRDQLRLRRYWTDRDLMSGYAADQIVTITGPAGTVIAEDPYCLHKVSIPVNGRRLAVQFLYTTSELLVPSFRPPVRRNSTTM